MPDGGPRRKPGRQQAGRLRGRYGADHPVKFTHRPAGLIIGEPASVPVFKPGDLGLQAAPQTGREPRPDAVHARRAHIMGRRVIPPAGGRDRIAAEFRETRPPDGDMPLFDIGREEGLEALVAGREKLGAMVKLIRPRNAGRHAPARRARLFKYPHLRVFVHFKGQRQTGQPGPDDGDAFHGGDFIAVCRGAGQAIS